MKPEFMEKNPPIDPKVLEFFESTTGYKLPDDYKEFLLQYNGGTEAVHSKKGFYFGHKLSYYNGEEDFYCIYIFYSLESNGSYFFLKEAPYEKEVYGIQLVIGICQEKLLCLCLEGDDYGCIFVLEDEYWVVDPEINFVKIANSFDEFINGFDYYPIE